MSKEWHYFSDQFESARTGMHGWRKVRSALAPNERESTHESGPNCHKLCREGQWPFPPELRGMAISGDPGIGPWGFNQGEHADSWNVVIDGRLFQLTRWPKSIMIVELQYAEHQPYSWIPNCARYWSRTFDWIGVQSTHEYL